MPLTPIHNSRLDSPHLNKQSALKKGLGNHYGSNPMLCSPGGSLDTTSVKLRPKADNSSLDRSDFRRHSYGPRRSKDSPLVQGLMAGYEKLELEKNTPRKLRKPQFGKEPPLWKSIFNER